jgi:hypothetical protein
VTLPVGDTELFAAEVRAAFKSLRSSAVRAARNLLTLNRLVWTAGGIVVNHAIVVYLAYLVPSRVRPSG